MRFPFLVCLLFVALVSGQTAPPAPAPAPAPGAAPAKAPEAPAPPPEVKPDDPVITIKNFCPNTTLEGDACKTVVTKAQFEKLAEALQPGMPPAVRRQLAAAYVRVLIMSTEAEKRGLDKKPAFDEALNFARMNVLSQQLSRTLQAEAGNVSDQDIQDYYQKNLPNYEQATFIRIFVPHTKRFETPAPVQSKKPPSSAKTTTTKPKAPAKAKTLSPEEQEKAGVEAMKKEAALLRERLIKGEDPEKLEKAAWTAAGLPGNPSPAKMEKVRRNNLPVGHQSVMDLKEGEVSEVISDNTGNYIYKLVHKETLPLDSVKNEIKNQLSSQRFRDEMQHFQTPPDLNDAYFGPSRPPRMPFPPRGPQPPGKKEEEDRD